MQLRQYQRESVDALYNYWGDGGGNGLIVIPTGGGKSLILATICKELLRDYPRLRIGIVTHVKELVQQNAAELLRVWPQAPIGIYSAGLGRRDLRSKILLMGIQSVHNKSERLGDFDVLLVDEVHLIPRNSDTMYGRFIAACKDRVPDMRIVGLTATPYRLDSGRLDTGKDKLFDDVIYDANVRDLIEAGFLSPLISKATLAKIDTAGLHRRAGEFVQAEMDARARIPSVVEAAVQEIVDLGKERAGWLAFCTGVEHAAQVRDEIRKHGISCESVTGETPAGERDSIIRRYKERKIRCLTSVGVLTTGFNAPHVDMVALLRPTLSTGLYVQMVGRAFRLATGKQNALILDFAGNVVRHGPVDAIDPQRSGGGSGKKKEAGEDGEDADVRAKECPRCQTLVAVPSDECPECGFQWPPPPPRHEARAAEDAPILTTEATAPKQIEVDRVIFSRHSKMGSPDSMRVTYESSPREYSQWVCFEHQGFARQKAKSWWARAGGKTPPPTTTSDAILRAPTELRKIVAIDVRVVGKYPEVTALRFGEGFNEQPAAEPPRTTYLNRMDIRDEDIPF